MGRVCLVRFDTAVWILSTLLPTFLKSMLTCAILMTSCTNNVGMWLVNILDDRTHLPASDHLGLDVTLMLGREGKGASI